jgi:hypothetical protein
MKLTTCNNAVFEYFESEGDDECSNLSILER